jgi:hypothetical protein
MTFPRTTDSLTPTGATHVAGGMGFGGRMALGIVASR